MYLLLCKEEKQRIKGKMKKSVLMKDARFAYIYRFFVFFLYPKRNPSSNAGFLPLIFCEWTYKGSYHKDNHLETLSHNGY